MADPTTSTYALLGVHGQWSKRLWQTNVAAGYGNGFQRDAGRWLTLDADAATLRPSGLGIRVGASALTYFEPFEYSAFTAETWPSLSRRFGSNSATLLARGTAGTWRTPRDNGSITVGGGALMLGRSFSAASTGLLSAELYEARNGALEGRYGGISAAVDQVAEKLELGASVKYWKTPADTEWGYQAYLGWKPGPDWRIDVQLGRSVSDPVLSAPPSYGISAGVSRRVGGAKKRTAVAVVSPAGESTRQVRFTVEVDADSVALSGSFSDWNPIPMKRQGRSFTVDVTVPVGTHHYGFWVNGENWYVPANADGVVDDDFGRKNATLVVARL